MVLASPDDLVLAEGIFAAEIVGRLEDTGMLHSAWCVHHRPLVTFARRLLRDLRERRKPPVVLVRRGWVLMRDEPGKVNRISEIEVLVRNAGRKQKQMN